MDNSSFLLWRTDLVINNEKGNVQCSRAKRMKKPPFSPMYGTRNTANLIDQSSEGQPPHARRPHGGLAMVYGNKKNLTK
ncbi:hypothetical protein T265_09462 [Opisthorchis viverrini]|uniref:Uncharacterized protein n=1 Tax=Opisthorchis viverrini TaxID=6198 RepID=A0A074Z5U9_OPIVI|nr:hypothetical protein T265_09462 [Opisthorchis viverrini]KER22448.1 hypothetical protein T265_09462 [Opisthorchis viverrini]